MRPTRFHPPLFIMTNREHVLCKGHKSPLTAHCPSLQVTGSVLDVNGPAIPVTSTFNCDAVLRFMGAMRMQYPLVCRSNDRPWVKQRLSLHRRAQSQSCIPVNYTIGHAPVMSRSGSPLELAVEARKLRALRWHTYTAHPSLKTEPRPTLFPHRERQ